MNEDFHAIKVVNTNFFCLMLRLSCMGFYYIMPMLEVMHEFIKFVLNRDTFVLILWEQ